MLDIWPKGAPNAALRILAADEVGYSRLMEQDKGHWPRWLPGGPAETSRSLDRAGGSVLA